MLAESESPEDVMARTSVVLSTISKNVGIVVAPPLAATVLKHIEFVDLGDRQDPGHFRFNFGLLQRKLIRVNGTLYPGRIGQGRQLSGRKISGRTLTGNSERIA